MTTQFWKLVIYAWSRLICQIGMVMMAKALGPDA